MNESLRALFPITEHAVYLNHAAVSPPPLPTVEAVKSQIEDVVQNGSLNYQNWLFIKERARSQAAALIGAERPDQIAFMRNTSDGLSCIANGLKWNQSDNVVTFSGEFPSNIYPWLHLNRSLGVEIRMCQGMDGKFNLDELISLIDFNTRIVAISYVQYSSGFRADLERIGRAARKHDALLVVDIIQAMGVLPLDVNAQLIDAAACSCHKWLLSPEGIGLLYLSDRARARLQLTLVGWASVSHPEDFSNIDQDWKDSTLTWETGTGPISLIHGLDASLNLLTTVGVKKINDHLMSLTDHLCENLPRKNVELISSRAQMEKSQIVSIRHKHGLSSFQLYSKLKAQNIITAPRGNNLRISPHFYNTHEDIETLLTALST
jgi:cysteine desulfurase / selenocysteine lyase